MLCCFAMLPCWPAAPFPKMRLSVCRCAVLVQPLHQAMRLQCSQTLPCNLVCRSGCNYLAALPESMAHFSRLRSLRCGASVRSIRCDALPTLLADAASPFLPSPVTLHLMPLATPRWLQL